MIDSATQKRIQVSTAWKPIPYIMLSVNQLDAVQSLLRDNQISYWVDSGAVSLNGGPEITFINLKRGTNAELVQHLLDAAN